MSNEKEKTEENLLNRVMFGFDESDFKVLKAFMFYAELQIDMHKDWIKDSLLNEDWGGLGCLSYDMQCLVDMETLVRRLQGRTPKKKEEKKIKLNTNFVLP